MINRLHLEMIRLYAGDPKRIQHFCKVHSYSKLIAAMENVDEKTSFILEAAALTHDIGIHFCEEKYGNCNGKLQEKEVERVHYYSNIRISIISRYTRKKYYIYEFRKC